MNIIARLLESLGLATRRPWPIPSPVIPPVVPSPAPTPPAPTPPTPAAWSPGELIHLVNIERAARHLPALRMDARLNAMAQAWSTGMAATGVLDHGDFAGRLRATYPDVAAAENIAEGQPDEDAVLGAWVRSPGHFSNLVGDWTAVGAGRAVGRDGGIWWAMDFVDGI